MDNNLMKLRGLKFEMEIKNENKQEAIKVFDINDHKEKLIRGSIWYADLGKANGSIQAGVRPVIIVSNGMNNKFSPTVNIVTLTTSQTKAKLPTHIILRREVTGLRANSVALCEQVITINKKQIIGYVSQMEDKYIELINKGISKQLELESKSYENENKKEEEKVKKETENFSIEYAQEILKTIDETERIYVKVKEELLVNMIKQYIELLFEYCEKFGRSYEIYKKKYERYLNMNTKSSNVKLTLIAR